MIQVSPGSASPQRQSIEDTPREETEKHGDGET